jgi:glycosidase
MPRRIDARDFHHGLLANTRKFAAGLAVACGSQFPLPVASSIEPEAPSDLAQLNLNPRGDVHPSPNDWGDQVLYFLLPDRFSDGLESGRAMYDRSSPQRCRVKDRKAWMESGTLFQGGRITGITSKLDYLKSLGATALWIGPVWKQRIDLPNSYHGYGIQNFLEIDPRWGTRQDLRDLVDAAHEKGMYVLLDVIINHTGNNFFYDHDGQPWSTMPYRKWPPYDLHGWRNAHGQSVKQISGPEDGVWPREFQNIDWYTRAGQIAHWDSPGQDLAADVEFRRGDFGENKDLNTGSSDVVDALCRCYQYWIALSDCDGFRIDTLKHIPSEVSAIFCHEMRMFARRIGKKNFLLLGEVTGAANLAEHYVNSDVPNLDAVLDIESAPRRLADFVKGLCAPDEFFKQFGGGDALGQLRSDGRHHVSILDDHDMVCRPHKHRFAWNNTSKDPYAQVAHAVGVQLTTPGIPCIYYGTEQAFAGAQFVHDESVQKRSDDGAIPYADRYVRECMFGGGFGAFESAGCHFFDPSHPTYRRIAAIARLRLRSDDIGKALRHGRLFVRETRVNGDAFGPPRQGEIAAWSRVIEPMTVIVALNTHGLEARGADVTIDSEQHPPGSTVRVLYRGDWDEKKLTSPDSIEEIPVTHHEDGRVTIRVDLPPAGMAIYG